MPKSKHLYTSLGPRDHELLQRLAEDEGRTLAGYIRRVLECHLELIRVAERQQRESVKENGT